VLLGGGHVMVSARCHRASSGPPGGVGTEPSGGEVEMALARGHQAASAWGHAALARSPGLTTALPRLKGEWAARRRAGVARSGGGSGAPCPAAPK
jgi:hypothetical protein